MKHIFKQTKVIWDAHLQEFRVYYKNFLFWKFEECYKVSQHLPVERVRELAIERAQNMLSSVEIYRSDEPY